MHTSIMVCAPILLKTNRNSPPPNGVVDFHPQTNRPTSYTCTSGHMPIQQRSQIDQTTTSVSASGFCTPHDTHLYHSLGRVRQHCMHTYLLDVHSVHNYCSSTGTSACMQNACRSDTSARPTARVRSRQIARIRLRCTGFPMRRRGSVRGALRSQPPSAAASTAASTKTHSTLRAPCVQTDFWRLSGAAWALKCTKTYTRMRTTCTRTTCS